MSGASRKPAAPPQALSPAKAVLWFFATPALLLLAFLWIWPYPPLWLVDVIAFGPLFLAAGVVALKRWGKPVGRAGQVVSVACVLSVFYIVTGIADVQMLDWTKLLLAALAIGVLASLPVLRVLAAAMTLTLSQKLLTVGSCAGLVAAYAYGIGALVNFHADSAPPQHFTARVIGKPLTAGGKPTGEVALGPWGAERRSVRLAVWSDAYRELRIGGIACVDLHRGILGLRWIDVGPCAPFERRR